VSDRDDLVAGANVGGKKRKMKGVITAIHADSIIDAHESRETVFEAAQLVAQNQVALGEGVSDGEIDLILIPAIVFFGIDEWHSVLHLPPPD
jgi:hypothetical protein